MQKDKIDNKNNKILKKWNKTKEQIKKDWSWTKLLFLIFIIFFIISIICIILVTITLTEIIHHWWLIWGPTILSLTSIIITILIYISTNKISKNNSEHQSEYQNKMIHFTEKFTEKDIDIVKKAKKELIENESNEFSINVSKLKNSQKIKYIKEKLDNKKINK